MILVRMATTTQNQSVKQTFGVPNTLNVRQGRPADATALPVVEAIQTRAYFYLKYTTLSKDHTMCDKPIPCFYSFTNTCDNSGLLLYSGFCPYHNQLLFNRQYIITTAIGNETTIRPIPLDDGIFKAGFPLFSLLKISDTQEMISRQLNNATLKSMQSWDNQSISKFLASLAMPMN